MILVQAVHMKVRKALASVDSDEPKKSFTLSCPEVKPWPLDCKLITQLSRNSSCVDICYLFSLEQHFHPVSLDQDLGLGAKGKGKVF